MILLLISVVFFDVSASSNMQLLIKWLVIQKSTSVAVFRNNFDTTKKLPHHNAETFYQKTSLILLLLLLLLHSH